MVSVSIPFPFFFGGEPYLPLPAVPAAHPLPLLFCPSLAMPELDGTYSLAFSDACSREQYVGSSSLYLLSPFSAFYYPIAAYCDGLPFATGAPGMTLA